MFSEHDNKIFINNGFKKNDLILNNYICHLTNISNMISYYELLVTNNKNILFHIMDIMSIYGYLGRNHYEIVEIKQGKISEK